MIQELQSIKINYLKIDQECKNVGETIQNNSWFKTFQSYRETQHLDYESQVISAALKSRLQNTLYKASMVQVTGLI